MSSVVFVVPSTRLRRGLLGLSAAAGICGLVLIASLPVVPLGRVAAALLWLPACLLELRALVRGMARVARLAIDGEGGLSASTDCGERLPLILLHGSLVLSRVAWLRLRFADGHRYGELLTGNPRTDAGWRRLQLLWRQSAGAFGRPGGS